MTTNELQDNERATTTEQIARKIAEYIYAQYHLGERSCVLDWRKLVCEFDPSFERYWTQFSDDVYRHFLRYRKPLQQLLLNEFNVIAIAVNQKIQRLVKHGEEPFLDNTHRTDTFYRDSLPTAGAKSRGIACFPGVVVAVNHPLVVECLLRRNKRSAKGAENAIEMIRAAKSSGAITADVRGWLLKQIGPQVAAAVVKCREDQLLLPDADKPAD